MIISPTNMNINKIMGYVLLILGLIIIIVALYQTYNIFTGKSSLPQVFKTVKIEKKTQNNDPADAQQQMQAIIAEMLPATSINDTMNLGSLAVLIWIFIFGGSKIAGMGIALIKIPNSNNEKS